MDNILHNQILFLQNEINRKKINLVNHIYQTLFQTFKHSSSIWMSDILCTQFNVDCPVTPFIVLENHNILIRISFEITKDNLFDSVVCFNTKSNHPLSVHNNDNDEEFYFELLDALQYYNLF